MTREEELDWLCRLRSEIYVYMPKEWLIPMNNALDMAIKALEQEPTTKNCRTCKNFGSHHGICEICKDNKCWTEQEPTTKNDVPDINVGKIDRPSVTPQEPFINKPCVSSGVCEHDKNVVLDKIRAEIEEPLKINQGLNTENAKAQAIALSWVLEVIDKYKADKE